MNKRMSFWVGVVLGLSVVASAVSNYDITLPSYPPGQTLWYPSSVNDNNQIVGPTQDPVDVYIWQNGTITEPPIPQGSFGTSATDINNAGHVVVADWTNEGMLWDGSQVIYLGTLGGSSSVPFALNESDRVVGSSSTTSSGSIVRPFVWQNNVMTSLGTLGGNTGGAYDINEQGVIVGFSNNASGKTRAFIYRNSTMTDLDTLGGEQANAVAINDANQVVGWSEVANGYQHAFIWENGTMTDLGTLGGNQSQALDINNDGLILGWAETATGYRPLVVWENGTAVRLNSLIAPDSGWELVLTVSLNMDEKPYYRISNNGAILGTGAINGGQYAFLMLPREEDFFMHDSNQDGVVDLLDFGKMSEEWLK